MDMGKVVRTIDVETNVPDFSSLMLNRTSLNALAKAGFIKPSPVQAQAIPFGMLGLGSSFRTQNFLFACASKIRNWKNNGFSLLAVENLNAQFGRPQVLIVAPTREIASQIVSYIRMLAPAVIHVGMFVGGNEKGVAEDIEKLRKSIHIVVGTTGRLCHLVRINALRLSHVRLFVLDEADKLMEDNFQKEINYLFSTLPPEKQIAVFSATYPYRLDTTLTHYMRDVQLVRVDKDAQLLGVKQCEELCADLQRAKFDAVSISGSMPQTDRTKAIRRLKNCLVKLLISTDLTARGIDAPGVNIVVNYGSPLMLATYLHRIGRAGRFGTQGAAFTIINSDKELKLFSDFVVEGKLRTKLLRAREEWPSNLIYDDGFFNSSEDFRPYTTRNWHSQQCHDVKRGEKNVCEFIGIGSDLRECGKEYKFYGDTTALHHKSEKRIYFSQDFYNIYRSMTNSGIPDVLLKNLVSLKIRSPYNFDLMRKNTLMMLRMGAVNKSSQDINDHEKSYRKKPFCLLNNKTDFTVGMGCRRKRYLRNQILSVRNVLSDEEWLRYANLRFGSTILCEPFLICGFNEGIPVDRSDEKYLRKSNLVGSYNLEELNPERGEAHERKKNGKKYETSEELKVKLAKIKSGFNYELVLGLRRMKECMTTTEVPEM
ncbi:DEAD/DEAH box helicase [Wuchereria bancrofti]|uniref:RNA helicase n=1 Tax=Wuchereria bancrofti TaxID=6293 RepID=J9EV84_WUCBA|nr:DEAD/DEAH box helicase [Wuchereria bancrofti]